MKSVSVGLDSISVSPPSPLISSSSFFLSTRLIYLLLLQTLSFVAVASSPGVSVSPLQSHTLPFVAVASSPGVSVSPLQSVVLAKLGLTTPPSLSSPQLPVPDHFLDVYRKAEEGMLDQDSIRLFYPQELLDLNSGLLLSYNLSIDAQQALKERVVEAHVKLRVRGGRGGSLRVYRVEDLDRLKVERLLDSVEITRDGEEERMVELDVTETVPYTNQHDIVRILVVLPEDCSLVDSPANSLSSLSQSRAASATMVVSYVEKDGEDLQKENEHPKRRKRFSDEEKRRKELRKERRRNNRRHRPGGQKGLCHRKSMYVDFEDLGWWDWILAPKGYDAYQCSGGCPFPFPAAVNASNHAIIQGLLHNYNDEVPEPCCVPTEMAPLTILFREVNGRITIKHYPDMIAMECGCR